MTRKFFRVCDDLKIDGRWHLGDVRTKAGVEPDLLGGAKCRASALDIQVFRAGRRLDFSLTTFAVPVADKSLAARVARVAEMDLQCVPVLGDPSLVVLNALRQVDCIDRSESEYNLWTEQDHRRDLAGQFRMVTKLVLDLHAIPSDAHFFRLWGWEVVLIVSDAVKTAMEAGPHKGALFSRVQVNGG